MGFFWLNHKPYLCFTSCPSFTGDLTFIYNHGNISDCYNSRNDYHNENDRAYTDDDNDSSGDTDDDDGCSDADDDDTDGFTDADDDGGGAVTADDDDA